MTADSVTNSKPTCDLFAVYATAKDIACAMAYIHSKDIIHGDLQGDALGLVTSTQDPRGFIVKVSTPLAFPFCPPCLFCSSRISSLSVHIYTCPVQPGLLFSDSLLTAKHLQLVHAPEATH